MKATFVDSGVLIAAARGEGGLAVRALAVLDDPERQFATSNLVKLEVLPKAIYQKNLVLQRNVGEKITQKRKA